MKISIEKRKADKQGHCSLRLAYYHGATTDENGNRRRKRSYESLDAYVYDKPRSPAERSHNKEALRIAEAVRSKRLLESATDRHHLEDRTKLSASFFDFYDQMTKSKESGSRSNWSIWVSAGHHLRRYHRRPELVFEEIDKEFLEGFKRYLLEAARTKSDKPLSRNTQSSYFNKIRAALNEAYRDGVIRNNPVGRVRSIQPESTQRTYLTLSEIRAMAQAECRYDVLKRAFLFSCTTGLRWSDIQKLVWREIEEFDNGHYRVIFKQKKIQNGGNPLVYLDLPASAVKLLELENRGLPNERVFKGLKYSSYVNVALLQWAMRAGVTKHVTFHAARHSFAVNQLHRGVDIYSLSRLLGHSELKTTEIYADILESRRVEAMRTFPDIFMDEPASKPDQVNVCRRCGDAA